MVCAHPIIDENTAIFRAGVMVCAHPIIDENGAILRTVTGDIVSAVADD